MILLCCFDYRDLFYHSWFIFCSGCDLAWFVVVDYPNQLLFSHSAVLLQRTVVSVSLFFYKVIMLSTCLDLYCFFFIWLFVVKYNFTLVFAYLIVLLWLFFCVFLLSVLNFFKALRDWLDLPPYVCVGILSFGLLTVSSVCLC